MIVENVNQGGDIETLAQDYGFDVTGKQPFTRDGLGKPGTAPPL